MPENLNHSILKSSSTADESPDENRHVHFDKMKEVQVFDRSTGSLIGQTPVKEKTFDTISSGGILTPQLSDMDISQFSNVSSEATMDKTMNNFEESINETLSLFEKTGEPAPEEFKLPEFDPTVANPTFWSTDAAKEFDILLFEELTKTQAEILKMFAESSGEYRKKLEFLKNSPAGEWAKTEQKVIVISSQMAESRLLNLRSEFIAEKNQKCEQEIVELQKKNSKISELVRNKKNEVKNTEDFRKVQDKYYEMKKEEMRVRLDSVMKSYEEQLEAEKERIILEMEAEELKIQMKLVADKEKEAKESWEKLMREIDFEWYFVVRSFKKYELYFQIAPRLQTLQL